VAVISALIWNPILRLTVGVVHITQTEEEEVSHPAAQRGKRPGVEKGRTILSTRRKEQPPEESPGEILFEPGGEEGQTGKPPYYEVRLRGQEDQ